MNVVVAGGEEGEVGYEDEYQHIRYSGWSLSEKKFVMMVPCRAFLFSFADCSLTVFKTIIFGVGVFADLSFLSVRSWPVSLSSIRSAMDIWISMRSMDSMDFFGPWTMDQSQKSPWKKKTGQKWMKDQKSK